MLALLFAPGGVARAATCTSTGTGDWSNAGTWSCAGAPPAPGGVPGTNDSVIIGNVAHTVTVTDGRTANSLQFAAGNQDSNLTINGGVTLTINGSMTVTGQSGGSGVRRVDVLANGQLVVGNDLILVGGSSNARDVELRLGDNANTRVSIGGDFGGSAAGGNFSSASRVTITFLGEGTIGVARNFGGNATLASGTGTILANGSVNQSLGAYNSAASHYHHLVISKSGGTATFAGNARIHGDITDNGNFNPASGNRTISLLGTAPQNLFGTAASTDFYRITLNNGNNLTLGHDLHVSNLLTLTNGSIITGASTVYVSNGSNISSAGGGDFVIGNLRKRFTANQTRTFEVGTNAGGTPLYSPVSLRLGQVTAAGDFTVSTTAGDHPSIATSTLDPAQSVNRYWTLANDSVGFNASANNRIIFTFENPGDLDGAATTGSFFAGRYNAPAWTEITPTARAATTTTLSGTNITTASIAGEYQLAEKQPAPPATGGFNAYDTATAGGAIAGFIRTKLAGAAVSVDMIALNTARTAIETGFFGAVRVEVLDASDNSGALDPATGCRGSWTVIQTLAPDPAFVAGDNGRRTIGFSQANAYPNARIRVSYPAASPASIGCSNDNFAIRPAGFASFSVSDGDWDSPGLSRALTNVGVPGGVVHKAGQSFSVRASAVNAAGTPAVTTNYAGTPDVVPAACGGSACAASFGAFSLGAAFSGGLLVSDAATYDEAGALRVKLVDDDFAAVDASDGSTVAERNIESVQLDVGRFVPDHFDVSYNMPAFETACGSAGTGFTYLGQAFNYILNPVISVVARDAGGAVTENYAGALWQITNASLAGKAYSVAAGSLDSSGITGTDPVIADTGNGTGTLTFSSGSGLRFARTSPVAPFNADISLSIDVIDADGVAHAGNPARFGQATAGNGIAFNDGKEMRFGRLATTNARGSPLVPLTLNLELQYWNGVAFITNTLDVCTTLAANNIEMTNFTQSLSACETSLTVGAFSKGRAIARLSKAGGANVGSVLLVPRLELTVSGSPQTCVAGAQVPVVGANRPYLEGRWDVVDEGADGLLHDDNPSARGSFGGYRGSREVIDTRENF